MLYRHYKGGLYRLLHEGFHSETLDEMTVYMSVKDGKVWVRPSTMFHELVQNDEENWQPRFTEVDESL